MTFPMSRRFCSSSGNGFFHFLLLALTLTSLISTSISTPNSYAGVEPLDKMNESRDLHSLDAIAKPNTITQRQGGAGLYWGPVTIGNLKLYLTNPHVGYAGPKFPNHEHVNFHVDKRDPGPRGTYSEVVNMHIVKYQNAVDGGSCVYAWDSVTKKTVFDECSDVEFDEAIRKCVSAIRGFVDTLLRNADVVAYIVIGVILIDMLIAALAGLAVVAV
ncbi:hypothetical protein B0O99DRAFT_608259 [Bisporella sp. PMI_857]|nr:hypothetical protein B0O99DRAFT_608259 [Bisporella sp. PMI_857]